MNSLTKGALHTLIPVVSIIVMAYLSNNGWADLSIGSLVGFGFNWLLSQTVPTTTGASANQ